MSEPEQSTAIVLPASGVVVDLDNEREVAIACRDIKPVMAEFRRVDRLLREAMARHKHLRGAGTFFIEGIGKVEVKGDKETDYNPKIVEAELKAVGCPEAVIREIVVQVIDYKVDGVRAKQAAAANPEYAAAIEKGRTVKERLPTVTVT